MYKINSAFKKIKNGESVTAAAFDSGYESLSGFNDSFKSVFGASPVNSKEKNLVNITRIETPLGTMLAGADENGICLLEFTDRKMLAEGLKKLSKHLNANLLPGENKWFEILKQQLGEYFEGKRKTFSIPISSPGTDFQQSVWKVLQTIPYGSTYSYKQQAVALMKPESVRAVANANGLNRIAIIIPCHRVIGEDGNLAGYGGGVWRKKWLLDFEKANLEYSPKSPD
jgi:AraC family transcriptional regulator of adaptative response/methylated-DNA-[protein]-cysteine methyltransferase